jgi:DNA repair protein RadC
MRIKQMPFYTTPWYKLKESGANYLDDSELLAVIFGKGNFDCNAIDLSKKLLEKYNLNHFSGLNFFELKNILKDNVKVYQILALDELFKRYSKLKKNGYTKVIEKAEDVYSIFVDELKDKKKEYLYALLLDTKNRVIKKELISIGTLNSSLIHPREVFREAVRSSANSIILVHNHPSGDCEPSIEDNVVTDRIKLIGDELGIKLLDHIIIGDGMYKSLI